MLIPMQMLFFNVPYLQVKVVLVLARLYTPSANMAALKLFKIASLTSLLRQKLLRNYYPERG